MKKAVEVVELGFGGYERCPASEMWRLELDRNRQVGILAGERSLYPNTFNIKDTGYLCGCFSGFEFVLAAIKNKRELKLDCTFLQGLHRASVAGVTRSVAVVGALDTVEMPLSSEFRRITETGYAILTEPDRVERNATDDGIRELLVEFRESPFSRFVQIVKVPDPASGRDNVIKTELQNEDEIRRALHAGQTVCIESCPMAEASGEEIQRNVVARIDVLFQQYLREEGQAHGDADKILFAIAKLIRGVEVTHPFEDGNCRTLNKLMNILLIRNNFPPTVLTNPNRIDAFSIRELAGEMRIGFKNYDNICKMRSDNTQGAESMPYGVIEEKIKVARCCYLGKNPNIALIVAHQIIESFPEYRLIPVDENKRLIAEVSSKLMKMNVLTQHDLHQLTQDYRAIQRGLLGLEGVRPQWTEGAAAASPVQAPAPTNQEPKKQNFISRLFGPKK